MNAPGGISTTSGPDVDRSKRPAPYGVSEFGVKPIAWGFAESTVIVSLTFAPADSRPAISPSAETAGYQKR